VIDGMAARTPTLSALATSVNPAGL
jgi:hypothetical protein